MLALLAFDDSLILVSDAPNEWPQKPANEPTGRPVTFDVQSAEKMCAVFRLRCAAQGNPYDSLRRITLSLWREDFAQYMREQGVPANATPRAVRGASRRKALDSMLRAQRRGASWAMRQKVDEVAKQIANGSVFNEPGRAKLVETRKAVVAGWLAVAKTLDRQGETKLAADVRKFVQEMPPVMTDKEQLAYQFVQSFKERITPQKPDPVRVPERTR